MKTSISILSIILLFSFTGQVQKTSWTIDKSHSKIQFDVSHMMISEVSGQFHKYEATIVTEKEDFSDAQIEIKIDASSIDTDNEKRDEHLRSADFFEVEKYPDILFKSTSMVKKNDNNYTLKGDMTMHGVTKPISLDVVFKGTIKDNWGNTKAGFVITGVINRTDYGLTWNKAIEAGGVVVGEEVNVTCKLELTKGK